MVNYLQNSIIYLNQGCLTIESTKKMFYADYLILGQIIEALNAPEHISSYFFKEREVKIVRLRYEPTTGEFLGLYETIGYIVVRGDDNDHFLNYGYDQNKSKLLYSFYKRRIPNYFGGTMLIRHRAMFESGDLDTDFSRLFFLPSIYK